MNSGGHLLDLINGVLDMSKIEAGKFELYEEMFELEDIGAASLRFVSLAAERGGVALESEIAPGDARRSSPTGGRSSRFWSIFSANGIKFTPPRRRSAHQRAPGGEGRGDKGAGYRHRHFQGRSGAAGQAFRTGGRRRDARAKEGTGLGLALVKSLAPVHGGEAVLESVLGSGTTVTVRLPYAAVDADGSHVQGTSARSCRSAARPDTSPS